MQRYFFLDSEIGYITVMCSPFRSAKTKVEVFHIFFMPESKMLKSGFHCFLFQLSPLSYRPQPPSPKKTIFQPLPAPYSQMKLCADIKIVKRSMKLIELETVERGNLFIFVI